MILASKLENGRLNKLLAYYDSGMPICKKCNHSFPSYVRIDGKIRNFSKRRHCLSCSPLGFRNAKYSDCALCQSPTIRGRKVCTACQVKINRWRLKLAAVEYKGGRCVKCGWQGHPAAFDFHHKDPAKKDFAIGCGLTATMGWKRIKQELDKCDLLCVMCHRILHTPNSDQFFELVYNYKGKMKLAAIVQW